MTGDRPLSERAAEAISWQESGWLGRLGGDVADVTLAATVDGRTLADWLNDAEAAARRLSEADRVIADLLAVGTTTHREFTEGDVTGCLGCYMPWPCPAERARLYLGADT